MEYKSWIIKELNGNGGVSGIVGARCMDDREDEFLNPALFDNKEKAEKWILCKKKTSPDRVYGCEEVTISTNGLRMDMDKYHHSLCDDYGWSP